MDEFIRDLEKAFRKTKNNFSGMPLLLASLGQDTVHAAITAISFIQPIVPILGNWFTKAEVLECANQHWQCAHQIRLLVARELKCYTWTLSKVWIRRHLDRLTSQGWLEMEERESSYCRKCIDKTKHYRTPPPVPVQKLKPNRHAILPHEPTLL